MKVRRARVLATPQVTHLPCAGDKTTCLTKSGTGPGKQRVPKIKILTAKPKDGNTTVTRRSQPTKSNILVQHEVGTYRVDVRWKQRRHTRQRERELYEATTPNAKKSKHPKRSVNKHSHSGAAAITWRLTAQIRTAIISILF